MGDALGAPVEFDRWTDIASKFGEGGVQGYEPAYGRLGAITDDPQMTLFTAEGLIRAESRFADRGIVNVAGVVRRAYERWLLTQVGDPVLVPWDPEMGEGTTSGWRRASSAWERPAFVLASRSNEPDLLSTTTPR